MITNQSCFVEWCSRAHGRSCVDDLSHHLRPACRRTHPWHAAPDILKSDLGQDIHIPYHISPFYWKRMDWTSLTETFNQGWIVICRGYPMVNKKKLLMGQTQSQKFLFIFMRLHWWTNHLLQLAQNATHIAQSPWNLRRLLCGTLTG